MSLQNNYMTYKKGLAKNINLIRAIIVKIDNFLDKRIIVNINDGGVDRCLQVSLPNMKTLRASELDVMIDRVNPVIPKDTQLLYELKDAQITAFPEAYLYPNKGKDDKQKPSGSNPSQTSKATGSNDKKQEEKKDDEKKKRDERGRKKSKMA
ncbi:hypothetical protein AgCh_018247 [Apium graveolens]